MTRRRTLHFALLAAVFGCATTPAQSIRPLPPDPSCEALNMPDDTYEGRHKRPGAAQSLRQNRAICPTMMSSRSAAMPATVPTNLDGDRR